MAEDNIGSEIFEAVTEEGKYRVTKLPNEEVSVNFIPNERGVQEVEIPANMEEIITGRAAQEPIYEEFPDVKPDQPGVNYVESGELSPNSTPVDPNNRNNHTPKQVNPSVDINITYSQLEENISQLKQSIATLKSSWNEGTKKNINTLDNSWVGDDCAEYTSKLKKMDKRVQNTISALELLCSAYEQARDTLKDNQKNIMNSIGNID